MTRVFLDTNIYFAGFLSPDGGSSLILELAKKEKISIYASRLVLREAERNLRKKTSPKTIQAFHRYLKQTAIHVVPPPNDKTLEHCEPHVHPKDVPVLAAAIESKVEFLITLDRRHFLNPQTLAHAGKIKIVPPGDFLQWYLR